MALITEIRKRSWLILVLLGLGLAGFIIMDITANSQKGGSQFNMGKVAGKKIEWDEFQQYEKVLMQGSKADVYSKRDFLWNYFVEDAIITREADALGLGVSKPELLELEFGERPSPIIFQSFGNPQTGQINRDYLNQIKQAIEANNLPPELHEYWALIEKQVVKERLQSKLGGLIAAGMYAPTWMLDRIAAEKNTKADFIYAKVPYDKIKDEDVKLEDADFKAYLDEHKAAYEQKEEGRRVQYLSFDVKATAADSAKLKEELNKLIPGFLASTNDSSYVESNYGTFTDSYFKKEDIGVEVGEKVFGTPVGQVAGPIEDGNTYKIVKVVDKMSVPDSVKSHHILIQAKSEDEFKSAEHLLDSLKTLITTGKSSFDSLAVKYSQDGSKDKGGDLGYAGYNQMVPEYNKFLFVTAKGDELKVIRTQFGAHLVQVTGKKEGKRETVVKIAVIEQKIVPSQETQNAIKAEAEKLMTANRTLDALKKTLESKPELNLESSQLLHENDYNVGNLGGGSTSRDIVKWAYNKDTKVGAVSPEVYIYQEQELFYDNKYVIVGLKTIAPKGLPTVDAVRDDIEPLVLMHKKAKMISDKIKGKDLDVIASEYQIKLDTVQGLAFTGQPMPGIGNDFKVIGTAMSMQPNTMSQPIEGAIGVYVMKMINKQEVPNPANPDQERMAIAQTVKGTAARYMKTLVKQESIEDYRSKFY